ncbi:MAG: hypothetical protein N4A48_06990 [Tepidibacter sp.]|jgi:hypothetical protein|nr:hypothetical protein [Tepidibacter sp.]MCT4508495.1 hypothetical protein [Tepidibacter sp.]
MELKNRFDKAVLMGINLIEDYTFKCINRTKETYFTRERKM